MSDQKLIDLPSYFVLPIEGMMVLRCFVDHSFGIELGSETIDVTIRIGNCFKLIESTTEVTLEPGCKIALGPGLTIFDRTIAFGHARKDGGLELSFIDGTRLVVEPDTHFESWELNTTNGLQMVSTTDRSLAIWQRES